MTEDSKKTVEKDPRLVEITNLYRNAVSYEQPISADLICGPDNSITISSKWSITDLDMQKKLRYEKIHLGSQDSKFTQVDLPKGSAESESLTVRSANGLLRAVVKEVSKDEKKCQFIEVWDVKGRRGVYDCEAAADKHGKLITGGTFASFEFSPDDSKILIQAEKKVAKPESMFVRKPTPDGDIGGEFRWKEDWGEQMDGCTSPVIVVINLSDFTSEVINPETDATFGQAVFTPDSKGLVFISSPNTPYRLGSIFCNNRLSQLMFYDLSSKTFKDIGEANKCIYSPRFTPNGKYLLYLQNEVGGPHQMGAQMIKYNWVSSERSVLVNSQFDPKDLEFPGLYWSDIGRNCFSSSSRGDFVYLETFWRSSRVILEINIESGHVNNLTTDVIYGKWQLLAISSNKILAARSSPSIAPQLVVGDLSQNFKWVPVTDTVEFEDIKWCTLKMSPKLHPEYTIEGIYIRKPSNPKHPLIVFPHGGPHATSIIGFSAGVKAMVDSGYGVLFTNYRGSLGFGEKNLLSLPGNAGDFDVKDVHQLTQEVLQLNEADPNKVCVFGGSHGGFLAGHLIGQYPDTYKAACLLNPVIDLSMMGPSDIPDWYWYEAGSGSFSNTTLPTDEFLLKARKASPIAHADNIKAPSFFFLGSGDLRVDKGQGIKLYKFLKAKNIDCRCNMYDDNHSLASKVTHDSDVMMNAITWFDKHVL